MQPESPRESAESTAPVIKPPAKPSMIGNGKPGKMPFRSSMKNVMTEPAMMPTTETMHGQHAGWRS